MCILYIFNYQKAVTLNDIMDQMGFDEETARKNIQSLMQPKARLIMIEDGQYKVNLSFCSKLKRITCPIPVLEEAVKREKITLDRSHQVDAAIVRIMKTRKKSYYNDLRLEVVTVMQIFKPDDALIKKRMEILIEREYLERDKNEENLMLYKA